MTMNNRREVRDFLVSRRAKITPEQAGLTAFGSNRRVPGLRREEVGMIAGVSVDYYTRLDKGNLAGVSESVLDAVARAPAAGRRRTRPPVRSLPHGQQLGITLSSPPLGRWTGTPRRAALSPGMHMSITSMSSRSTTLRQSVSTSAPRAVPQRAAPAPCAGRRSPA
jgi:hypothetical protein